MLLVLSQLSSGTCQGLFRSAQRIYLTICNIYISSKNSLLDLFLECMKSKSLLFPLFLCPPLCPLTIPIPEQIKMRPHNNGILHKLLHTIDKAITISTRQHTTPFLPRSKLRISFWHRTLVRYRKHPHPTPKDTERVDSVEGLRAAADLSDGEGSALGWADGAG